MLLIDGEAAVKSFEKDKIEKKPPHLQAISAATKNLLAKHNWKFIKINIWQNDRNA